MLAFFLKSHRQFAVAFVVAAILCMATLPSLLQRTMVVADLSALLPQMDQSVDGLSIQSNLESQIERQLVLLINAPSLMSFRALAEALKEVEGLVWLTEDSDLEFTAESAPAWVDEARLRSLQADASAYASWLQAQIYSPVSGVGGERLLKDPLLLSRNPSLFEVWSSRLSFDPEERLLYLTDDQSRTWYLLRAQPGLNSLGVNAAQRIDDQIQQQIFAWQQHWPESRVLQQGAVFYLSDASRRAQADLKLLGSLTVLGVLSLILMAFRSFSPLLVCLLSIGTGVLTGSWAVLLLFEEIHLLTLVMSVSVIGVSVDYVLYYLVEQQQASAVTRYDTLKRTWSTLFSAMLTTVFAYAFLAWVPVPVFRQLAVFSVSGIFAAFLVVTLWLPYLKPVRLRANPDQSLPWVVMYPVHQAVIRPVPLILLGFVLLGALYWFAEANDDPGLLQSSPQGLVESEQQLAELLGRSAEQSWLFVYGKRSEQVLQRLESSYALLDEAILRGMIQGYDRLPVRSLNAQARNVERLDDIYEQLAAKPVLGEWMPLDPPYEWKLLTYPDWQAHFLFRPWEHLAWSGPNNDELGLMVPLSGVAETALLRDFFAHETGVRLLSPRADYEDLFRTYRLGLQQVLLLAVLGVVIFLVFHFGLARGLRCALPVLMALLAVPALTSLAGLPVNLFIVLAMFLVLGVGINYALFFSNLDGNPLAAYRATFLAAATTLMTLGILVWSSTQAISSFGWALTSGLVVALLLSPLAAIQHKKEM